MLNVIEACQEYQATLVFFDNVYLCGKVDGWMREDTPDASKATVLLGNTPSAFNQIWHLPTDKNALTGEQFIEHVANAYQVKTNYSVLSKRMIRLAGIFNSLAKESIEMIYQNEYDYLFDSSKFEKTFFQATNYQTGIQKIAKG